MSLVNTYNNAAIVNVDDQLTYYSRPLRENDNKVMSVGPQTLKNAKSGIKTTIDRLITFIKLCDRNELQVKTKQSCLDQLKNASDTLELDLCPKPTGCKWFRKQFQTEVTAEKLDDIARNTSSVMKRLDGELKMDKNRIDAILQEWKSIQQQETKTMDSSSINLDNHTVTITTSNRNNSNDFRGVQQHSYSNDKKDNSWCCPIIFACIFASCYED